MDGKMWMGIPGVHMAWVPCPQIDSVVQKNRYIERIQFENGGGDLRRSPQYQMEYQINVIDDAHTVDGVDVYNKFASGFYGDGLIYMAYPPNFYTNMFAAAWATPALIEEGWANIATDKPTFSSTNVNQYGQPRKTATWSVTNQPNTYTRSTKIVIPPTNTLWVGASGLATGGAALIARPINVDGTYADPQELTLLSKSGSTRMNTSFDGSTYQAVEFYITRTTEPETTRVNLILNSSFENGLTRWATEDALISQSFVEKYVDDGSAYVEANIAGGITSSVMAVTSGTYFASAWVKGEVGKEIKIGIIESPAGTPIETFSTPVLATGDWQRISVSVELDPTTTQASVSIINAEAADTHNFYVDAVLFEKGESLGSYFNGFTPDNSVTDNSWQGTAGDSASIQVVQNIANLSITSMMAQLHPIGATPALTSTHYTGEGHTGLQFADDAIVETYSYLYPPLKGISTTLVEVEAWR